MHLSLFGKRVKKLDWVRVTADMMFYAVAGVSAEWVDKHFTSLRMTLPEGGMYKHFSPDNFYTIRVEAGNDEGK